MLSAIRTGDRRQVILLREDGLAQAEHLREEARQGRIVCEVCSQPLVVRAGEERIWHFAHRTLENCPKAQDSLEVVECRALLYGWLRVRFPDAIQLEKVLPGLPRPADCWVDRPGQDSLAWWVIPAAVKPELRDLMLLEFCRRGTCQHPVFPSRMLDRDPNHPGRVSLSATLRDFTEPSAYGAVYGGEHLSLHFLDPERRRLISCRGLLATHPPKGHQATILDHPLEQVRLHPRTGEFVHPGEFEALKVIREEAAKRKLLEEARRRQRQAQDAERRREYLRQMALERAAPRPVAAQPPAEPEREEAVLDLAPAPPQPAPEALLTCKVCGVQTVDWVVRYGSTGLCKCRACTRI